MVCASAFKPGGPGFKSRWSRSFSPCDILVQDPLQAPGFDPSVCALFVTIKSIRPQLSQHGRLNFNFKSPVSCDIADKMLIIVKLH